MCAMTERDVYDITIIGAGPTGLFAAFYAGMRQARTQVIDSLEEPGGALTAIYPEKYIYDVPGFPKVMAKDFVEQMVLQAERDQPTMRLSEEVLNLELLDDGILCLTTTRGERYSKTVIICAGVGAFEPKRIDAPGVADLEGKGVHYFAKRVDDFREKDVVIVGGGDSAVDWAVTLEPVASHVTAHSPLKVPGPRSHRAANSRRAASSSAIPAARSSRSMARERVASMRLATRMQPAKCSGSRRMT